MGIFESADLWVDLLLQALLQRFSLKIIMHILSRRLFKTNHTFFTFPHRVSIISGITNVASSDFF